MILSSNVNYDKCQTWYHTNSKLTTKSNFIYKYSFNTLFRIKRWQLQKEKREVKLYGKPQNNILNFVFCIIEEDYMIISYFNLIRLGLLMTNKILANLGLKNVSILAYFVMTFFLF